MENIKQEVHSGGQIRFGDIALDPQGYWSLIKKILPSQGCIEVQRDGPGKEYSWHHHDTDETLVIIEGKVKFYWEGGEKTFLPGSVIWLPARTKHRAVASDEGVVYFIAFEDRKLD